MIIDPKVHLVLKIMIQIDIKRAQLYCNGVVYILAGTVFTFSLIT